MGHPLPGRRLAHRQQPLTITPPTEQRCSVQKPLARPKVKKKVPARLPDKSEFHVHYTGEGQAWVGHLTILGCPVFNGQAQSVFGLLSKLDWLYRQWLRKVKEAPR